MNMFSDDKTKLQKQSIIQSGTEMIDGYGLDQPNNILVNGFENHTENFFGGKRFFQKRRKRIVLKRDIENLSVLLEHIALFYYENKVTYAIDLNGEKYVAETNLLEFENELDNTLFFRANRQFIININYIKSFRNYERVKLMVTMKPEELNNKYCIIISQDKSPVFKKWIYAA